MTIEELSEKYASCATALFNVRVTMTINSDGTVTRNKSRGVKPMILSKTDLENHIDKMSAQLRKLLAM